MRDKLVEQLKDLKATEQAIQHRIESLATMRDGVRLSITKTETHIAKLDKEAEEELLKQEAELV
jgi:prefoldin subunit 5